MLHLSARWLLKNRIAEGYKPNLDELCAPLPWLSGLISYPPALLPFFRLSPLWKEARGNGADTTAAMVMVSPQAGCSVGFPKMGRVNPYPLEIFYLLSTTSISPW